jgi:hypothetical protein
MPTDALLSTLLNMKRAGRSVALILVGGSEPSISTDGLTIYHIRDDVAWADLETLSIEGK